MAAIRSWTVIYAKRVRNLGAVLLAFVVLGAPSAQANDCGQTITVQPRQQLGPGPAPLAVGDSVLYDAADALSYYGFKTNAMVCRTMAQGIVWLADHGQNLPTLVVIALGTNGSVTSGQIDQLLSIVGPDRTLAMVTPHNGNYAYVPGLIRAAAQEHPGRIEVLDWDRLSAGHPDWFAPDGIHLGGSAGINAFAHLVANALLAAPAPTQPTTATPTTQQPPPQPPPTPPRAPAPPPGPSLAARTAALAFDSVQRMSLSVINFAWF